MELVYPDIKYKETFLEALQEFRADNISTELNIMDIENNFRAFCSEWEKKRKGIDLKPDEVPETMYWAIVDGKFVGRIVMRHYLNEHLSKYGGHIGYAVISSERRKGYGTEMTRRVLPLVKEMGIDKALITIDHGNIGSEKIVKKFGATKEKEIYVGEKHPRVMHYWIAL